MIATASPRQSAVRGTMRERVLRHFERYPVANRAQIMNGKNAPGAVAEALRELVREGQLKALDDRCQVYVSAEAWPYVRAYYERIGRVPAETPQPAV